MFTKFGNFWKFLLLFLQRQNWGIFSKNRDCKNIELSKFVDYMLIEKGEDSKFVCGNILKMNSTNSC